MLPSTNDHALQLAAQTDLPTPLLVLAEEQTAGRGRGSHRWWSQAGALAFSLVLDAAPLRLSLDQWPRVALTAAVAVCQVLEDTVPRLECGIRWPNDVFVAGQKICGILPELPLPREEPDGPKLRRPGPVRLVLGIGINVNNSLRRAPADLRAIGTSLFDLTGDRYDLTDLLVQVLERLSRGLIALAKGDPQLVQVWAQRCVLQGRTIELQTGLTQVRGICKGIDSEGALVLHTPRGRERSFGGVVTAVE